MTQIIIGIIVLVTGTFLVIKTEWFLNNFGRISWFEAKLSSEGGSRLGYKLIGIILITLGIILTTGSGDDFMLWLLAPLLKYS
ncbi:MAG: hypothetical protein PWQ35_45 [Patescibacteria group bacterium]|nr:hypothetical protein [Patescibacteria group bacterium]